MRIKLATLACVLLWLLLSALISMAFLSRAVISAEQEFDMLGVRLSEQLNQKLLVNATILVWCGEVNCTDRKPVGLPGMMWEKVCQASISAIKPLYATPR